MEGKKYIKKIHNVSWNSLSEVKKWLEEMALKGYKLVEVKGGNTFLFEKNTPGKIHYAVEVLPKGSIFDTHPSQKSEEYIDFCENVGWNFVDCTGNIYFFSTEEDDVVAIETDEKLKFQTVKKAVFKGKIITSICGVIIALLNLLMNFTLNLNTIVLSPIMFETNFLWILVLGLHSYNLIRYYLWVNKAKRIVNAGGTMPEEKQYSYWVYIVILLLFAVIHSIISVMLSVKYGDVVGYTIPFIWIGMFVILFFSRWVTIFAEKNKIGRTGNLVLQLVALPAICTMLLMVIVIGVIVADTEERSEIMIKKEDAAIFFPETDFSQYSVECRTNGNFILAMDSIFITPLNESDPNVYDCSMVIYRSDNERILKRLLHDINKFRTYSIYFDIDRAEKREEKGVVIYEAQTTKPDYEYLIYDTDTILCLYSFREKLNQEQLAYLKETILNK